MKINLSPDMGIKDMEDMMKEIYDRYRENIVAIWVV